MIVGDESWAYGFLTGVLVSLVVQILAGVGDAARDMAAFAQGDLKRFLPVLMLARLWCHGAVIASVGGVSFYIGYLVTRRIFGV
ncbi:MAG: hypothetical protein IT531_03105 [Burkholderiales bacterium]|nr:hypothetical protein [Burkholderiales bacterium]